jgi:hypothetical protein
MRIPLSLTTGAALALLLTAEVYAQAPTSTQLARQLVTALAGTGVDAIAARDPEDPGRAIAALVFPESQLLVVSAPYPDAAGLDALLTHRMYREVYSALQQPSISTGKVFFQDMGCDGFQPGSVDVMYENGKTQTVFDGDWRKQKLSQSAYQQRVREAETRYARLLSALVSAAGKPAGR